MTPLVNSHSIKESRGSSIRLKLRIWAESGIEWCKQSRRLYELSWTTELWTTSPSTRCWPKWNRSSTVDRLLLRAMVSTISNAWRRTTSCLDDEVKTYHLEYSLNATCAPGREILFTIKMCQHPCFPVKHRSLRLRTKCSSSKKYRASYLISTHHSDSLLVPMSRGKLSVLSHRSLHFCSLHLAIWEGHAWASVEG